jgi:hypothetical protein
MDGEGLRRGQGAGRRKRRGARAAGAGRGAREQLLLFLCAEGPSMAARSSESDLAHLGVAALSLRTLSSAAVKGSKPQCFLPPLPLVCATADDDEWATSRPRRPRSRPAGTTLPPLPLSPAAIYHYLATELGQLQWRPAVVCQFLAREQVKQVGRGLGRWRSKWEGCLQEKSGGEGRWPLDLARRCPSGRGGREGMRVREVLGEE